MRRELFLMFLATGGVLTIASVTGVRLRAGARENAVFGRLDNLNARIKAWWWITLIFGGAVFAGRIGVIALFGVVSFIALREFLATTSVPAADRRTVVTSYLIALPIQYGLIGFGRDEWFAAFLPMFGLLLVPLLNVFAGDTRNYLARTSELLWGLLLCVYCVSFVPALLMLQIAGYRDRQVLLVEFLALVTQTSDVMQYVWGKLIGRHKIAPEISPAKTVEGLMGGIASGTALGAGLWWMTPFSVVQAGAMAFLITLAGFAGGLVMSAIKRDRGLKDWSQLIPGHGGMLDRVDSIWLSAPMFYYATRCFFGYNQVT